MNLIGQKKSNLNISLFLKAKVDQNSHEDGQAAFPRRHNIYFVNESNHLNFWSVFLLLSPVPIFLFFKTAVIPSSTLSSFDT